MITAVVLAALLQSAVIDTNRSKYLACLGQGIEAAKTQKMPADALEAHLRQSCASVESSFEAALIAFDVKNKVSRSRAASDAQMQVDDYVASKVSRYKAQLAVQ